MVHLAENQTKLRTFCEDSQIRHIIVSKSMKKLEDGTLEEQGI
jgi:hypothetical protein